MTKWFVYARFTENDRMEHHGEADSLESARKRAKLLAACGFSMAMVTEDNGRVPPFSVARFTGTGGGIIGEAHEIHA